MQDAEIKKQKSEEVIEDLDNAIKTMKKIKEN